MLQFPPQTKKQTPVEKQYHDLKKEHFDKILMFQLGDFYEMFAEDAVVSSKILNIQLTSRNKNNPDALPMCGLPIHSAEHYIHKLVKAGHKVALCRQVEDASKTKEIVKREVVRIVTPSTVLNEDYLQSSENNYLASVGIFQKKGDSQEYSIGVSYCDVSTGEFFIESLRSNNFEALANSLNLKKPSEIIFPDFVKAKDKLFLERFQKIMRPFTWFEATKSFHLFSEKFFDFENCKEEIFKKLELKFLGSLGLDKKPAVVSSLGAILFYLRELQVQENVTIRSIQWLENKNKMMLDESTLQHLDLFSIENSDKIESLYQLLNQTNTAMGARMLRIWVSEPLLQIDKITDRQEAVAEFIKKTENRNRCKKILEDIFDIERLSSRIFLNHFWISDFAKIRQSLIQLAELKKILKEFSNPLLKKIYLEWDDLKDLLFLLTCSIEENPTNNRKEGGYIKKGYHVKLDEWRNLVLNNKDLVQQLEKKEQSRSSIPNLKIRFNRISGFFIEISKNNLENIPQDYRRCQTLTQSERFVTTELKELEEKILSADEEIIILEEKLLLEIREKFCANIKRLQKVAKLIAGLDCLQSLASVSLQKNYSRPSFFPIEESQKIELIEARHPLIEATQENEPFVANDLSLNQEDKYISIITGPNMGGKSTYMKQTALILVMAQMGCFVPAKKAKLSVFKQIFTRIGASDNILKGESTFMVEMNEAATILHYSDEKSFVILDEIGRGTSTYDGISIAWAILEFLHEKKIMTLFATHYHELVKLDKNFKGIINLHLLTQNKEDRVVFLRKIKKGFSNKSYGVEVAQIAGLPLTVLQRANQILKDLEQNTDVQDNQTSAQQTSAQQTSSAQKNSNQQTILLPEDKIRKILKDLNLENTTPIEALNLLQQLKKKLYD